MKDYIDYLYNLLINDNAEISMCHLKKIYSQKCKSKTIPALAETLSGKDAIKAFLYQKKFTATAPGKMYKSELFHTIRYPVGFYYEDMAVICQLLDTVSKVVIGNQEKYCYVQRKDSIMREPFNSKKLHRIEIAEEIHLFISKKHPDLTKAAAARCFLAAIQTYKEVPFNKEYQKYINLVWEEIVKYRKNVLFDKNTKLTHKIISLLTYLGKHCLCIFGNCYSLLH